MGMLIHKPTRSLVLTEDAQEVRSFIPHSKHLVWKGHHLTVVPHGLDETIMLRNLGVEAPSPILHHFNWTGPFPPYVHQKETSAFLTLNRRAFVFNGLGSGKTFATIEAAEYLMRNGYAKRALILCCLSTITPTWQKELFTNVMHRTVSLLTGSAERRLKRLKEEADYYVVNHDALRTKRLLEALCARDDIDLIIVDEASMYRNSKAQKYKALTKLATPARRLWLLTATPCPKDPTDAWALARLVDPKKVPSYFTAWRDQVMRQITQFKWIPKPEGLQLAYNAMQPAIRYRTEDCIDLPERVFLVRRAPLSETQVDAYTAMRNSMQMKAEDGTAITAANAGVALMKLVQIACGVVRTGQGDETVNTDATPRLDVLREVLDEVEADAKAIIFAPFKAVLPMIAAALEKDGHRVEVVSGETGKAERDAIFEDFQHNPEGARFLVAHPACMSHGLTLTAANTTVWYAPITNSETVEQANARTYRNGQKRTTRVVEIYSTAEEKRLYEVVRGRQELSGTLMDMYRKIVEGVEFEE